MAHIKGGIVLSLKRHTAADNACYEASGIHAETGMGGIILSWQSRVPAQVMVRSDGQTAAELQLYPAPDGSRQLYPLNGTLQGSLSLRLLCTSDDVQITEAVLCPAEQMVTGTNPVITADVPDPDIIRVGDVYYMASTTMHNMPCCTLLRSYDLIHWEIAAHVCDTLPATEGRRLQNGKNAYGQGMWAPSLRYHKGVFHICFSANDTHCTYHYQAESIDGPWQMQIIDGFYHDCSLFFDDDDRCYMVYGNRRVYLTELNADLTGPKKGGLHRLVLDYGDAPTLGYEGSHLYKHDGKYVLFTIHSNRAEWYREESCFISDALDGTFTGGVVLHDDMGYHRQGVAQGGMVDTPDGRWFAFLFQDRGASGRMPVLMPMHWENGMPVLAEGGRVSPTVCNLTTRPGHVYRPITHSDDFTGDSLSAAWQWNHIPQPELIHLGGGALRITTDQVCSTLTQASNILTQRSPSPLCITQVTVSAADLQPGDIAGIGSFQSCFAAIGLRRDTAGYSIITMARDPEDPPQGRVTGIIPWPSDHTVLRVEMDFRDMRDKAALYVQDGDAWRCLLQDHQMRFTLDHFTGNKIALFTMATEKAGGTSVFEDFVVGAD